MNKKILIILALFSFSLMIAPAFAAPAFDQMLANGGVYKMVAKDTTTWEILSPSTNPFGQAKVNLAGNQLTVSITAHKLVPGNWYLAEVVDKSAGWNPISPSNYAVYYGKASKAGKVEIAFTITVASGQLLEILLKNADNVALKNPSAYGVPADWILGTGQGWTYVLWGATLLPIA